MVQTTNEAIQDALTERDVNIERYKRGLITRVLNLLGLLEEKLYNTMQKLDPTSVQPRYTQARVARLMVSVQGLIDEYSASLEKAVVPDMTTLAKDEAAFGIKVFQGVIPVAFDTVTPNVATLKAAVQSRPFQGKLLKEWVRDQPASVKVRLRSAIRQGVAEGQTIGQMIQAVRGTAQNGYADGIMEVTRRSAAMMVRTAVSHTVNVARNETYAANQDIIKGVRWVSTLDTRTSDVCRARDGMIFPINKGPRPPAHPNCRSSTVPVVKSWKELGIDLADAPDGTRASMDGQVGDKVTYQTWLKGKPAALQDEILGPTKGKLFRDGGLTLDQFVDNSGHSYTLDELRKRAPDAFKKAGLD